MHPSTYARMDTSTGKSHAYYLSVRFAQLNSCSCLSFSSFSFPSLRLFFLFGYCTFRPLCFLPSDLSSFPPLRHAQLRRRLLLLFLFSFYFVSIAFGRSCSQPPVVNCCSFSPPRHLCRSPSASVVPGVLLLSLIGPQLSRVVRSILQGLVSFTACHRHRLRIRRRSTKSVAPTSRPSAKIWRSPTSGASKSCDRSGENLLKSRTNASESTGSET